jgi:hypothetical protein
MSSTVCLIPIIAALFSAETTFIRNDVWNPINQLQEHFIANYFTHHKSNLDLFNDSELKTRISNNVNVVNNFLADNNFNIKLDDLKSTEAMYMASIMNILVKWAKIGAAGKIKVKGVYYPTVIMEREEGHNFHCYSVKKHSEPIIELATQSDDTVYITVADKDREGFNLLNYLMEIQEKINDRDTQMSDYNHITFPMIDIDDKPDINWLVGMKNLGWRIMQAIQQTKFQMNEEGAAAQSAVAISAMNEGVPEEPKKLVIDKPFFLWIMRSGVPVFAGHFKHDVWKKPQKLG